VHGGAASGRPGSSAARRTRELLGSVVAGVHGGIGSSKGGSKGDGILALGGAKSPGKAGALKRGGGEWGNVLDGSMKQHATVGSDGGEAIPVARGLVKGSTAALKRLGSARQQR
jgi:hypothetical protein